VYSVGFTLHVQTYPWAHSVFHPVSAGGALSEVTVALM